MLTHRKHKLRSRHVVAVALACATALTFLVVGDTLARPADVGPNSIVFINQPSESHEREASRNRAHDRCA